MMVCLYEYCSAFMYFLFHRLLRIDDSHSSQIDDIVYVVTTLEYVYRFFDPHQDWSHRFGTSEFV